MYLGGHVRYGYFLWGGSSVCRVPSKHLDLPSFPEPALLFHTAEVGMATSRRREWNVYGYLITDAARKRRKKLTRTFNIPQRECRC